MAPLIGPIGLDYVAAAADKAGIDVEVGDLGLADQPEKAVKDYFSAREPELVGLSFRNADDCFWPSADWFVPGLKETIKIIRAVTNAPIVIGGVGFSIFAGSIVEYTGADFGIGKVILVASYQQDTQLLFAGLVYSSAAAIVAFLLVTVVEKLVVRWQSET